MAKLMVAGTTSVWDSDGGHDAKAGTIATIIETQKNAGWKVEHMTGVGNWGGVIIVFGKNPVPAP